MKDEQLKELILETKQLNPLYKELIVEKLKGISFEDKTETEKAALAFGLIDTVTEILAKNIVNTAQGDKFCLCLGLTSYKDALSASLLNSFEQLIGEDIDEYFKI